MILIDANVLIATAHAGSARHAVARAWLRTVLDSGESFVIPDQVWLAFFRILSSPRATNPPVPMAELFAFARGLRDEFDYLPISGIHDRWDTFEELVASAGVRGDLTSDAYLATLARELRCAVATFDRDFRRFDDVVVVVPGS